LILLLLHRTLDMSHNAIKDGEAVVSTALPEKASPDPVVADVKTFDIDSQDLPEGYFRSPYFIGTLVAAGLSLTAVSSTETGTEELEAEIFRVLEPSLL
jgi:hypothetical protein